MTDKTAKPGELLSRFPEINFSNYGQQEVEALQAWAFEAFDALSAPPAADDSEPAEALAARLIDVRAAALGHAVPWAEAVEITATITKMAAEEKAALLAMDDAPPAAGVPAVSARPQTCNGKRCGWCKEGAEPCHYGPPAAGVPEGLRDLLEMLVEPDARKVRHASDWRKDVHRRAAALLQALAAAPTPTASEQQRAVFAIPDMDEHLLQILGRPNFWCSNIAQVLRLGGAEINRKAEHEQAVVIHWMLTLYLAHGAAWWDVATQEIKRIQSEHLAKGEGV